MNKQNNFHCLSVDHTHKSGSVSTRKPDVVTIRPNYTSHYDEETWEVAVTLAGVKKDHVRVSIENEILNIEASRTNSAPKDWKPLGHHPREIFYRLKLDVGPEVTPEKISAVQNDGILILRLPLRKTAKPKLIPVR